MLPQIKDRCVIKMQVGFRNENITKKQVKSFCNLEITESLVSYTYDSNTVLSSNQIDFLNVRNLDVIFLSYWLRDNSEYKTL